MATIRDTALTASTGLDVTVVSSSSVSSEPARASRERPKEIESCWFLFIQHQSFYLDWTIVILYTLEFPSPLLQGFKTLQPDF